jgi:hypothetical protein
MEKDDSEVFSQQLEIECTDGNVFVDQTDALVFLLQLSRKFADYETFVQMGDILFELIFPYEGVLMTISWDTIVKKRSAFSDLRNKIIAPGVRNGQAKIGLGKFRLFYDIEINYPHCFSQGKQIRPLAVYDIGSNGGGWSGKSQFNMWKELVLQGYWVMWESIDTDMDNSETMHGQSVYRTKRHLFEVVKWRRLQLSHPDAYPAFKTKGKSYPYDIVFVDWYNDGVTSFFNDVSKMEGSIGSAVFDALVYGEPQRDLDYSFVLYREKGSISKTALRIAFGVGKHKTVFEEYVLENAETPADFEVLGGGKFIIKETESGLNYHFHPTSGRYGPFLPSAIYSAWKDRRLTVKGDVLTFGDFDPGVMDIDPNLDLYKVFSNSAISAKFFFDFDPERLGSYEIEKQAYHPNVEWRLIVRGPPIRGRVAVPCPCAGCDKIAEYMFHTKVDDRMYDRLQLYHGGLLRQNQYFCAPRAGLVKKRIMTLLYAAAKNYPTRWDEEVITTITRKLGVSRGLVSSMLILLISKGEMHLSRSVTPPGRSLTKRIYISGAQPGFYMVNEDRTLYQSVITGECFSKKYHPLDRKAGFKLRLGKGTRTKGHFHVSRFIKEHEGKGQIIENRGSVIPLDIMSSGKGDRTVGYNLPGYYVILSPEYVKDSTKHFLIVGMKPEVTSSEGLTLYSPVRSS